MRSPQIVPAQRPADSASEPAASDALQAAALLDRQWHAWQARAGAGWSPVSVTLAALDWALHWANSPATATTRLSQWPASLLDAWAQAQTRPQGEAEAQPGMPLEQTVQQLSRALLEGTQTWWQQALALPGVAPHHREVMRLLSTQTLNFAAAASWPLIQPEVLRTALQTRGQSLLRGAQHRLTDWHLRHGLKPWPGLAEAEPANATVLAPGQGLAGTPGEVVFRNELVELIQYAPSTATVQREPVFIVPSWIMKYYILDLSPHNSLVRYLVSQGHTVFITSWRNPDAADALLGMDDYLQLGVFEPLAQVHEITQEAVHAMGYCLGGTLLAIAAAALAARRPGLEGMPALRSLSLLAAQVDFTDPGELGALIDEHQVQWLEDMMAERGYLSGRQMGESFQFLHSRELIWQRAIREYLLGERASGNDLMSWNADVTRMPATMHSEYLRSLYLHNDLAQGRYPVAGQPVSLHDLSLPAFVVGTLTDHVSPWTSVYKIHQLTQGPVSFVLTRGGHNAGILSEPGHPGRSYQTLTLAADAPRLTPEQWREQALTQEGSWWPAWSAWLGTLSTGEVAARQPVAQAELGPAPGRYVLTRHAD